MYDGSSYAGWQRLGKQDKKSSIQDILEACISECLGETIKIIGSGRTDAGVHALGQVANFHCHSRLPVDILRKNINNKLPEDIVILEAEDVEHDFHSRYSAKVKTYEYLINLREPPNVFTIKYAYHPSKPLNLEAMKKASKYIIGTHDFKAFSTDRKDNKSTIRTVESLTIVVQENVVRIRITGDGFLYNMVRIIVGTLIEIGEGLKKPEDIPMILESRSRQMAGITVSSHALFLVDVRY